MTATPEAKPLSATQRLVETLARERLIGIIRTKTAEDALWAGHQLAGAGFRILEVTYTVPQADEVIRTLADAYPDSLVGAGTVLDVRTALRALASGARFLVSPVLEEALLQFGVAENVPVVPGIFTPTEAYRAVSLGAGLVKLFPAAQAGGPGFVRALLGPFPQLLIVPTGGVTAGDVGPYLQAGALAVGVGSQLMPDALGGQDESAFAQMARACRQGLE